MFCYSMLSGVAFLALHQASDEIYVPLYPILVASVSHFTSGTLLLLSH